ncbi:MAG: GC-type dockerin domain-anchored protein [Planctomycetota bacterium]
MSSLERVYVMQRVCAVVPVVMSAVLAGGVSAQPVVVAVVGQPVPGVQDGTHDRLFSPVVTDDGVVHFITDMDIQPPGSSLSEERGVVSYDAGVSWLTVSSIGTLPGSSVSMDNGGFTFAVARAGLSSGLVLSIDDGVTNDQLFVSVQGGSTEILLRDDAPMPLGGGTAMITPNQPPEINDAGQVVATGEVNPGREPFALLFDPVTGVEAVALDSGFGAFSMNSPFETPSVNSSGKVLLRARDGSDVVLLGYESGSLATVVSAAGAFGELSDGVTGDDGSVAFQGLFRDASNNTDRGLFVERGGSFSGLVTGMPAPQTLGGTLGEISVVTATSQVEALSQGRYAVGLRTMNEPNGSGGSRVGQGVFITDGQTDLAAVRQYEAADGGGVFDVASFTINWTSGTEGHVLHRTNITRDGQFVRAAFRSVPGVGSERLIEVGESVMVDGVLREVTGIERPEPRRSSAGQVNASGDAVLLVTLEDVGTALLLFPNGDQRCPADVNGDGTLNDSDFFAWVTAFVSDPRTAEQEEACDVNRDGSCSDSDFFAWVTEFIGAGCG